MPQERAGPSPPPAEVEERVLLVVRALARETGGPRAERAVSIGASLEREVGLGSLERVELLLRLEQALGRALDDRCLALDSAADLARAVMEAPPAEMPRLPPGETVHGTAPAVDIGDVSTLHASLRQHAAIEPERTHVRLRLDDGSDEMVGYGRLWTESVAVAGGLIARGVARGDTVALMLPTGNDFLRAFMGVILARAIPVPIYPPARLDRLGEYADRQAAILKDACVTLLITVPRARPMAGLLRSSVPTLTHVVSADELASSGAPVSEAEGEGGDPALIQYTSGSTGRPKGVLLTHDNLLANIRAIASGVALEPTDVGVSWLPLYHDMGLIGSWLFCLHHGIPLTLLSPTAFLARPERWLWAIHERRATLSPAPNFAYELCARRLREEAIEGLDLSSWRVALNGAEPVSRGTLERFARRFRPHGFREEAMLPVYGLAECSVALAFPPTGRKPRVDRIDRAAFERDAQAQPASQGTAAALDFVSAGRELPGHEIRIVDDSVADLPERVVGRLLFRGPSAMSGYFRNPEATQAVMLQGGWIDSGDLAYRADGEVHPCGRLKDLIIKGGRNLVPQEIEEAAAEVDGVRRGCVAAFGVPNATLGTEALVVVAETRIADPAGRDGVRAAVLARVAAVVDLPPDEVVLVEPGSVPKTPSGKLRRSATRSLFLAGKLGQAGRTTTVQRLRLAALATREALRAWVRSGGRALYAAWLALALPPTLAATWLLALLVPQRRFVHAVTRLAARLALRLTGCPLEVRGLDHLPRRGPCVLVTNHASYTDVAVLLALLPVRFLIVAKREVLANPFFSLFVRRCGHLTVDRRDAAQGLAGTRAAGEALRAGEILLFFPEGTFTAATGLRPFRLGAFRAAAAAGAPLVPLALRGTRRVMRGDWRLPRPGPISLWIGEAVSVEATDLAALVRLREGMADRIAAECGEPRLDAVAAGPLP